MRFVVALGLAIQLAGAATPPAGSATTPAAPRTADGAPPLRDAAPAGPARTRPSSGPAPRSTGVAPLDTPPIGAALTRLRGGGDEAPLCRSGCAGRFYRCASGGDAGDCATDLRTCRALCDTASQPPGRLVSTPPLVGLPTAAPLQGFVSPPSTAPPPR